MKGKILLVVGLGIGYVLGTRAGRERYEEIKSAASKLWNDPRVQKSVDQASDFVTDGASKIVSQVTGSKPSTRATSEGTSTPTRRPAARKTGTSSSSTTK